MIHPRRSIPPRNY